MIETSKKDEFLAAMAAKNYKTDPEFYKRIAHPDGPAPAFALKDFVAVMNAPGNEDLRRLFREATAEADEAAQNPAAGLAGLFGTQE